MSEYKDEEIMGFIKKDIIRVDADYRMLKDYVMKIKGPIAYIRGPKINDWNRMLITEKIHVVLDLLCLNKNIRKISLGKLPVDEFIWERIYKLGL